MISIVLSIAYGYDKRYALKTNKSEFRKKKQIILKGLTTPKAVTHLK